MKAVVMAGGKGTRLRPLTYLMAKPTVPVVGKPCIYFVLKSLVNAGIKDIIITSGYRVEDVMYSVGEYAEELDANIIYSYEYQARGTAGGVKKVESFLDETFIVTSGDVLCDIDFKDVVDYHVQKKAFATMTLTEVENVSEYGVVQLDEGGKIMRFQEKPSPEEAFSNLINAGIYVLEPDALDYVPKDTKFDFSKHTFPKILEDDRGLYGRPLSGLWKDIGRPSDIIDANLHMSKRLGGEEGHSTLLDEGSKSREKAELRGVVYLGPGSVMGDSRLMNSYIYQGSSVGEGCNIEDSLILNDCEIGDNVLIKNSIVGPGTKIRDGVKLDSCVISTDTEIDKGSDLEGVRMWDGGIKRI